MAGLLLACFAGAGACFAGAGGCWQPWLLAAVVAGAACWKARATGARWVAGRGRGVVSKAMRRGGARGRVAAVVRARARVSDCGGRGPRGGGTDNVSREDA